MTTLMSRRVLLLGRKKTGPIDWLLDYFDSFFVLIECVCVCVCVCVWRKLLAFCFFFVGRLSEKEDPFSWKGPGRRVSFVCCCFWFSSCVCVCVCVDENGPGYTRTPKWISSDVLRATAPNIVWPTISRTGFFFSFFLSFLLSFFPFFFLFFLFFIIILFFYLFFIIIFLLPSSSCSTCSSSSSSTCSSSSSSSSSSSFFFSFFFLFYLLFIFFFFYLFFIIIFFLLLLLLLPSYSSFASSFSSSFSLLLFFPVLRNHKEQPDTCHTSCSQKIILKKLLESNDKNQNETKRNEMKMNPPQLELEDSFHWILFLFDHFGGGWCWRARRCSSVLLSFPFLFPFLFRFFFFLCLVVDDRRLDFHLLPASLVDIPRTNELTRKVDGTRRKERQTKEPKKKRSKEERKTIGALDRAINIPNWCRYSYHWIDFLNEFWICFGFLLHFALVFLTVFSDLYWFYSVFTWFYWVLLGLI